jgi:hypothetical protein
MYTKSTAGDETILDVSPPPSRFPWILVVVIFGCFGGCVPFVAGGAAESIAGRFVGYLVTIAAFPAVFWYLPNLYRRKYLDMHRRQTRIAISRRGVTFEDELMPAADIHRVMVKNHLIKEFETDHLVAGSLGERMAAGAQNSGNIARRALSVSCYRVDVEVRGAPRTVAGGLLEPEASAIALEIGKALRGVSGVVVSSA